MTTFEAGLTRDQAFELLNEHNKDPFHIEHAEAVEGCLRYFAQEFDPDNVEFWGLVGLLHDLDWEEYPTPEDHTLRTAEMLRAAGGTEQLIHSIQTHNSDFNEACPAPELFMEKVLFAADELTGLIGAAALMRPSKSVQDLEVKSVMKKFKTPKFAAGCSREVIAQGAEKLGWSLEELMEKTILAMRSCESEYERY